MPPELTILALAGLLQVIQFSLYSVLAQMQVGTRYAASSRDTPRELTGTAGRAQRALNNHVEGLTLFTAAVVVVTLSGQSTATTQTCAYLYLAARIVYLPAYLFGWVPWRSFFWFVGLIATTVMLISALI